MQAADEEELVHLQNLLTQSQAAEAEAIRQAGEATQRLSAASTQHVSQLESELQEVCILHTLSTHLDAGHEPNGIRHTHSLDVNILMWEECSHLVLHAPRYAPSQLKVVCTFLSVPRLW